MPLSPYCHFERKREIFFVCGQAKDVRIAASGKHRAPSESEGRCFMQTALRKKTETGNEKDPSTALGMTKRGNASFHSFSTCYGSHPCLAALGSPFQRKGLAWTLPPSYGRRCPEGAEVGWEKRYPRHKAFPNGEGCNTRISFFSHCHFVRKREIFFVCGQAKDVRIAASGKHRAPSESEGRCFMQTALRKKTETGNEKDPSAALGMTKRGNASFHSFSTCCGSQPRLAALGSPFQGKGLAWTLPLSYGEGYEMRTPLSPFCRIF